MMDAWWDDDDAQVMSEAVMRHGRAEDTQIIADWYWKNDNLLQFAFTIISDALN